MKRPQRFAQLLMVSVFGCALLAGCSTGANAGSGGSSAQKKDITLIVKCPTLVINAITNTEIVDAQMMIERAGEAFAKQYEDANVTLDVRVFDHVDEMEAIAGSFDTDHAPDILYEDYFNMAAYVHTGRVVPLDNYITDEIRSDIDDSAWEMSMVDGKTYMMPYLSRQNILMFNKALMRECGLDAYCREETQIQNWTTEEWTQILDILAEKLPKGVYPIMMYGKNNQGDTHIMSMIRAYGSQIFDADGNFDFKNEKAVKALAWIQDGVEKGWYAPHSENLEIADAQELFNNNQIVFYVYNNANHVLYDNLANYGFVNFPGNVATSFVTGFEVFDNGDEAKIKVAGEFIKYIYETDEWLELSVGNIPVSKKTSEKYADQITMLDNFSENAEHVVDFMNNSPNWQGNETSVRSVFWPNIHNLLLEIVTPEECAANLDRDCNAALETGRRNSTLHE